MTCVILGHEEETVVTEWFCACGLWPFPAHQVTWKGKRLAMFCASVDEGQLVDQKKMDHVYYVMQAEKQELRECIPNVGEDEQSDTGHYTCTDPSAFFGSVEAIRLMSRA